MSDAIDIETLTEGRDFEAKLAQGQNGRGELPKSFFETYSAFANTEGGVVLLGVREQPDGTMEVSGIVDVRRVQKALWDGLNNRERISANLLTNSHVEVVALEGKSVLRIVVPRATRKEQPVFVGSNPLGGTFRRGHEGDYRAPEEIVRRMLAERVEDVRDARVIPGTNLGEIDHGTLSRYRQVYRVRAPAHPWNQLDDREFLRSIGGFAREHAGGDEGLTGAGLLMFGKLVDLREAYPHYMLDYQEQGEPGTEPRWLDRLTTDGSWSGNLYDFYHAVIVRLTRDLRVPFRLRGDTRVDDTSVHEALREALVNTLIHADYTGRLSVRVVRRPDLFDFRNPGAMRMPVEAALRGGMSDCRNRRLQDMFRYVGLGEQAGSGIAKIRAAWKEQHWRAPAVTDAVEPYELTQFTLRMASLLPSETVTSLEQRYGDLFGQASEIQKLALVTAALEQKVTHARLRTMTDAHTRDVTVALSTLVQKRMLESGGAHKGTFYFLPGSHPVPASEVARPSNVAPVPLEPISVPSEAQGLLPFGASSVPFEASPVPFGASSVPFAASPVPFEASPVAAGPVPSTPISAEWEELQRAAGPLRARRKAAQEEVRDVLVALCRGRFLTLPELSRLTGRTPETLRIKHVNPLVTEGRLALRFARQRTHPAQAYTALQPGESPGTPTQPTDAARRKET
ncbi:MAG: putative DNA binding domain-containing protein [Myxococcales bacterium]|nr:putative DNA binding domain-containing protein [Myxococcales bacterium]